MTYALMVSSLRMLACFICNEQVWLLYCSLSWQWYIFETNNLADKIYFMFSSRKWETRLECDAHNQAFLAMSVNSKKKKAKLLLSGLNKTLFPALYMSDVSHHVTWIGMFSEWPLIKRKKFAHLGFFNIKGMYGN